SSRSAQEGKRRRGLGVATEDKKSGTGNPVCARLGLPIWNIGEQQIDYSLSAFSVPSVANLWKQIPTKLPNPTNNAMSRRSNCPGIAVPSRNGDAQRQ